VRERFARQFRLDRALIAIHRQPWLIQGRGFDLVSIPHQTAGEALRRMVWDEPPRNGFWKSLDTAAVRHLVEAVRVDIIQGLQRFRPAVAEIAAYLTEEPRVAFGWFAAFGAASRVAVGLSPVACESNGRRGLATLESLNLLLALHGDLLREASSDGPGPVWGRNTLNLVLADCLTAYVLGLICRMDPPWCRYLGSLMRRTLRREALTRMSSSESTDAQQSSESLFAAAASMACARAPSEQLPPELYAVAKVLARMRRGTSAQSPITDGGAALGSVDIETAFSPPLQELLHALTEAPRSSERWMEAGVRAGRSEVAGSCGS